MRYILLLLLVMSCSGTEKEIEEEKHNCNNVHETLIATMTNGCKTYKVVADVWILTRNYCSSDRFMYTDCPADTVKWNCGKNCEQSNSTIEK